MINTNQFDANDVLIDQTMVCEASRLLLKTRQLSQSEIPHAYLGFLDGEPSDVERLLHLSMLLDALALHEHLYVLNAELPADATKLELRKLLLDKGIIKELDTVSYVEKVCRDFQTFLDSLLSIGQINSLEELLAFNQGKLDVDRRGIAQTGEQIVKAVRLFLNGKGPGSYDSAYSPELMSYYLARERTGPQTLQLLSERNRKRELRFEQTELADRPLFVLGDEMLNDLNAFDSGHAGRGVSHLRTFLYWRISEHARIVLYPSCRRAAQIDLFTDYLRAGISEKVYHVVAQAFESTLEMVYADEAPVPLFLPPTLAIFLEIYQSTSDLSEAIDEFRAQFAPMREAFQKLENDLLNAKTLRERVEIKDKILKTLKSLASHHELKDEATLETVIGYAELVAKPFSNPLDPSKYSKELLLKPVDWIKGWWRDRPLRTAFQLKKRLQSIEDYEHLASRVLGLTFDRHEKELFLEHYNSYLSLHQRKPRALPKDV
jgi:hypothetical protein